MRWNVTVRRSSSLPHRTTNPNGITIITIQNTATDAIVTIITTVAIVIIPTARHSEMDVEDTHHGRITSPTHPCRHLRRRH